MCALGVGAHKVSDYVISSTPLLHEIEIWVAQGTHEVARPECVSF